MNNIVFFAIVAVLPTCDAFLPSTSLLGNRRQQVRFAFSQSKLDDAAPVELQRQWFQAWGFAEPETKGGSSAKKPKAKAGKGKKGKPAAKAPSKGGGFGEAKIWSAPPPDDMMTVFTCDSASADPSSSEWGEEKLRALGAEARETIDGALPATGAVLLRGLPMRSAEEFGHFWRGCLAASDPPQQEGTYISLGPSRGRTKMSGIDLATNVPPEFLLLCHNELCYNPTTVGRIALYCVQDAPSGGETIMARNRDLATSLSPSTMQFLEDHGGIMYSRVFQDARKRAPGSDPLGSWQEKCALPETAGPEEAEAFFKSMGFDPATDLTWAGDGSGALRITNRHPGILKDPDTGEPAWWNIIHTGSLQAADGTPFPKKIVAEVQRTGWLHTRTFKLVPGDWLMLDNLRVQHGRLPYTSDPSKPARCLLTVYADPVPSF
mmetsp:Transcript_12491/g.29373  ORF Transcript_12491/g.29373 Transcript_12491/m.29373 type:complete len:434 (-) Transcript_12491:197-1498(-)